MGATTTFVKPQKNYLATSDGDEYQSPKRYEESSYVYHEDGVEEQYRCTLPPVDGKQAWLVAFSTLLISIPMGLPNAWGMFNTRRLWLARRRKLTIKQGVMQDYYQRTNTFSEPDANAKLTFAGSLFQGTTFALVFFTNILYSIIGPKKLLILATLVLSFGLTLAGRATSISTLYFSLSLCVGFGIGATQAIATRIVPGWFIKYRSTACGIHACMLPFGGLVFPYVMVSINKALGPSWTFYIIGIVSCMANMVAYTIIREREPTSKSIQELKNVLDFGVLRNANLVILLLIHPLHLFAQYIAYAFLPLDATYIGLSDVQGATLVSILSGTSLVGRICTGYFADRIGNLNMYILSMMISTYALSVVWVSAHTFIRLALFALMNGFVCGCFASVVLSLVLAFVGPKDYPAANGIRSSVYIVSVFGPLLAGRLESMDPTHPFVYSKIVAGGGAATAGLLALVLKLRMDRRLLAKV